MNDDSNNNSNKNDIKKVNVPCLFHNHVKTLPSVNLIKQKVRWVGVSYPVPLSHIKCLKSLD
jgi:hypothetical protein